jgi:lysophospholipase L1-like esterase
MKRFENGARVCFVGDSITAQNGYLSHIVSYYRRHFPNEKIRFFNCGVAGGSLVNAINTYDIDIACYNPTHIVLTIGVNDSERTALENKSSSERYAILKNAYESFIKAAEEFYILTRKKGVNLIICTPPPYAEYQAIGINPLRGGYALMLGYAEFFRTFAKEHSLPLCDYNTRLTELIQTEELFNPDCVHPNERGHYRMAEIFLESQGLTLDTDEIDDGLCEWRELTLKIRKIFMIQYLALPFEHYKLEYSELIEKITQRKADIESGMVKSFDFMSKGIEEYLILRPHLDEYVKSVIEFMEK